MALVLAPAPDETAGQAPSTRLGYKDFESWARWYDYNRTRSTGRPASRHTLRTKAVHLAASANLVGATGEVFLGEVLGDRRQVNTLLTRLASKMTPGAMRQAVYALRDFGRYSVEMGWSASCEVYADDVPPKNPPTPIHVYSDEEMERFVSAARGRGLRWWALICFLADTGRRAGEALALEWSWLRLDQTPAYFELPWTKNGKPQYVPLSRRLREEVFTPENIETLKHQNKRGTQAFRRDPAVYLFPWGYGTVHASLDRFCEAADLPNRGFHNFRHTVITSRLAAGVPLQAVAALAGHSSAVITDRRYNHTDALTYAQYVE